YQILGMPYCDYEAYDIDGNVVKASDFYAGKPTVVILWATWCAPCRAEAIEMVPIYEQYSQRGLNFMSVAREFDSPDKFKEMVTQDQYPWPCLYDLDNKFGIFDSHGTSSSGLYLIDADGNLVATGYDWADLAPAADQLLPE
ncbi:MAG: TlpA family protein disulfide reductase, partial [Muribaculaceae bacterium]|nr:TlpA family protein disulfide reductase [Muribaculaceae bacterium]